LMSILALNTVSIGRKRTRHISQGLLGDYDPASD
jgi:hypothetical protein